MTTTDLDRWAEQQVAYGSPDYVRGYRDGIDDTVQAAKDLGVLADRSWWTDQGHESVIRLLHTLGPATGLSAAISYLATAAQWWPKGCDHGRLARAAYSTLNLREAEIRDLRDDRHEARKQYLAASHGVIW